MPALNLRWDGASWQLGLAAADTETRTAGALTVVIDLGHTEYIGDGVGLFKGTSNSSMENLTMTDNARAQALIHGRDYVLPEDIRELAVDVLAHRLVLSFDALADGRTADEIAALVVAGIEPPRVAPSSCETTAVEATFTSTT